MAAIIPCEKCIHGKVCAMGFQFRRETANVTIVCKDIVRKTDVAPRAEVEKLHEVIFKKEDLMQKIAEERNKYADELEVVKDTIEHLKAEVAREIFEEIENIIDKRTSFNGNIYALLLKRDFAELKNKYAEDKPNDN